MDLSKLSRKDIAYMAGVDVRTISRWVKDGLPKNQDGTYDSRSVIRWLEEKVMAECASPADETEESQHYLAEYRKHRARIAELDCQEREGTLIPRSEVEKEGTELGSMIKNKLVSIPGRIAALVVNETDPFKCEQIMKLEINQILQEMADEAL